LRGTVRRLAPVLELLVHRPCHGVAPAGIAEPEIPDVAVVVAQDLPYVLGHTALLPSPGAEDRQALSVCSPSSGRQTSNGVPLVRTGKLGAGTSPSAG